MAKQLVGIDFGTSNSAVSYYTPTGPKLVELLPGQFTIPSAIFAEAETGAYLFGKPAIEAYISGTEGRLLRSLKSILGSSLYESRTELHNGQVEFKTLLALFFGHLKKRAEEELGAEIRAAVIGRPVFFVGKRSTNPASCSSRAIVMDAMVARPLFHAAGSTMRQGSSAS